MVDKDEKFLGSCKQHWLLSREWDLLQLTKKSIVPAHKLYQS